MRSLIRSITIITAFTLLPSCSKAKEALADLLSFTIEKGIPQQDIPGTLAPCQVVNALNLPIAGIKDIKITKEEDFPEQNTELRLIQSARLEALTLILAESSPEKNWDWMESITVSIQAKGMSTQKLASLSSIANGQTVLNIPVEGINIADYIKADGGFTLSTDVSGCPPQNTVTFHGKYRIEVKASPL